MTAGDESGPGEARPLHEAPEHAGSWCRAREVVWRHVLDGVVVMRIDAGAQPLELNSAGGAVWEVLDRTRCIDEVVELLADLYDVAPQAIRADVEQLLEALEREGLAVRVPGGGKTLP